jgi:hypothetical protein
LLVDTLLEGNRLDELGERLWLIRGTGDGSVVARARETLAMATLAKRVAARDYPQAVVLWTKVLRIEPSPSYLQTFTDRVEALADTPVRRIQWRAELQSAKRAVGDASPLAGVIGEALRRAEKHVAGRS